MALTPATFALNVEPDAAFFPEFAGAGVAMLQLYIDKAKLRVSDTVFGDEFDQAHAVMTAKLLAQTQYGQQNRLVSKTGRSTYDDQWDQIAYVHAAGGLVL